MEFNKCSNFKVSVEFDDRPARHRNGTRKSEMNDADFLATFLDEADETLERWEAACLKVEHSCSPAVLDELFRSAHNIKGSSKSVGLSEFGALVHKAEDLITKLKNGEIKPTPEVVAILLDCQKALSEWIVGLRSDRQFSPNTTDIRGRLDAMFDKKSDVPDFSAGFGFFDDEPAKIPPTPANNDVGTILINQGKVTPEQVEAAVNQQNRKLGEVLVDNGVVSPQAVRDALDVQKAAGHRADETIRVSLRKLDSVIRLIGELSIQHAIVTNAKSNETLTESSSLEAISLAQKVIQDLQSETMALRMQPLEGLFQRMERVCRDVARQQQKPLNVVLKGTEVELDKTVIERMKDPLVHILRNAVDHGIETPDDRKTNGKAEYASVTIEGVQTAANVSIRILDDGRGLNREKILRKAQEKGLIASGAKLSPEEIDQLIFLPGFSTAEKVTDVSGRGVGMDVVKRAVDELGGSVSIESKPGKGTQFVITLPSTLSILDAVVVGLSEKLYAVPVQDIEEVVDMSSVPVETTTQRGRVINLRGRILPVESLREYLPDNKGEQSTRPGVALIAKHQHMTVAFEVDRVAGQQSIVVRQLEGQLSQVPGFAGGTILQSGEPSMILHLPQVVKSYMAIAK